MQTEEIKLRQAGTLNHYGNDQMNRVYSKNGLSPTILVKSGGGRKVKIEENPESIDDDNIIGCQELPTKIYIRKFTEEECFRLMGVKKEDYELVKKNQTSTSLYHLPGDSIVTTCLMAILGKMLDIDYDTKIKKLVEELKVK